MILSITVYQGRRTSTAKRIWTRWRGLQCRSE